MTDKNEGTEITNTSAITTTSAAEPAAGSSDAEAQLPRHGFFTRLYTGTGAFDVIGVALAPYPDLGRYGARAYSFATGQLIRTFAMNDPIGQVQRLDDVDGDGTSDASTIEKTRGTLVRLEVPWT